jgi:TPR repeat protein
MDYAEAMGWYRKAADQGDRNAENLIGTLYSNGLGVPRNLEQAGHWFSKAGGG